MESSSSVIVLVRSANFGSACELLRAACCAVISCVFIDKNYPEIGFCKMSSPPPNKKRIDADVIKLIETKREVTMLGGLNEFLVKFYGPKGTPYEGGVWKVRVDIPDKYPYKSPSIGFLNKIYHPNIDEASGTVCLDVINQAWTPLYDLSNIFDQFLPQLLSYPNPIDPLNGDAAAMSLHKPEEYQKKIREYVQKYATEEVLEEQENPSSSSESSMSDYSEDETEGMEL
ncbi:ubiquitin-conjugating enzyme E2 H-like [Diadema setosum]|uniref:ubiquitin-conjugating enzyme E2 H-like n=1 Tax=Diadema antillarum TaxID=105358 RepID=UPI003A856B8B